MTLPIIDGTGQGYLARVDSSNRLRTKSVTRSEYNAQNLQGEAFNVNSELISIGANTETNLVYLKNNELRDIILFAWFIGKDQGTLGASNGLIRAYMSPTSVSGGSDITVVNRKAGDPKTWLLDVKKSPTWTPSGTPVLYQTQTLSQRVFGEIYLVIPPGQSIITTCEFSTATTPFKIYQGFTGFLVDEGAQ